MVRKNGWKRMPVLLKIVWIFLLIGVVFSIPAVFTAATAGYQICGMNVYGLWAANLMFLVNLLLPIFLLIAMIKRYAWTWIYGVALYLFMIINGLLTIKIIDQLVQVVLNQMPEAYLDVLPNVEGIAHASIVAGIIWGALIDGFFLVVFIIKRKYFAKPKDAALPGINQ